MCPLSCISISVSRDDELVASDGWSQDEFCLDIISPPVTWSWSWSSPRHQLWSQIWAITTNVPLSIYSVQPTPAATAHTDPAPGDKNSLVKLNQTFISSLLWERRARAAKKNGPSYTQDCVQKRGILLAEIFSKISLKSSFLCQESGIKIIQWVNNNIIDLC